MNISTDHNIIIKKKQELINRQISETMDKMFQESVDSTFDIQEKLRKEFNIRVASNQIDVIEAIKDNSITDIALTDARSGGKTFGVSIGVASESIEKRLSIGITAPTSGQANRIINTFKTEIVSRSPYLKSMIDWRMTTNTRVIFTNGSIWESFSAAEVANNEGRHPDWLLVDEAQNVSDFSMSQILLPMIGSSKNRKVIKVGVPRCKNHFWRSSICKTPGSIYLVHDWLNCPNLMNGGIFNFNGINYPESVLSRMPLIKWQQYFPDNSELWRDGDMTVEDFETQYEMKWLLDSSLFLNENEQLLLFGDYIFEHPETEEYFFGLDLAGGANIKTGNKRDFTALVVGRIKNGQKQICDAFEFQGDAIDQMDDLIGLIHPNYGKYRCKFGFADYGFNPMMVDALAKAGVNIEGIMFGARDKNTGKMNKNAMFESFKFELQSGRIKYPKKEFISKHKVLKKHFEQWCVLEEKKGLGINSKITAPDMNFHDDGVMATILLNKAMLTIPSKQYSKKKEHKFPQLISGISSMVGVERAIEVATRVDGDNPFNNISKRNNPFGSGPQNL